MKNQNNRKFTNINLINQYTTPNKKPLKSTSKIEKNIQHSLKKVVSIVSRSKKGDPIKIDDVNEYQITNICPSESYSISFGPFEGTGFLQNKEPHVEEKNLQFYKLTNVEKRKGPIENTHYLEFNLRIQKKDKKVFEIFYGGECHKLFESERVSTDRNIKIVCKKKELLIDSEIQDSGFNRDELSSAIDSLLKKSVNNEESQFKDSLDEFNIDESFESFLNKIIL